MTIFFEDEKSARHYCSQANVNCRRLQAPIAPEQVIGDKEVEEKTMRMVDVAR